MDTLTPGHPNFWATSSKAQDVPSGVFTDAATAKITWGGEWGV